MGTAQSQLNSEQRPISSMTSVPFYCDASCKKQQKLDGLWQDYQNKLNEQKNLPKKLWKAKYNYYVHRDGPTWINNFNDNQINIKLNKLRQEKQKNIKKITDRYNDKIQVLYTQNTLLNKQNKIINQGNILDSNQLNKIEKVNEEVTTKSREIYFKEIDYRIKVNKLKKLRVVFLILIIILAIILLYYFLTKKGKSLQKNIIKTTTQIQNQIRDQYQNLNNMN
jgi:hypothetical protein